MKIRPFSDLHIEFEDFNVKKLPDDKDTICVLAGDIGVAARPEKLLHVIQMCAANFKHVFYVLGNHEFYHGVFPNVYDFLQSQIELHHLYNVSLLQNSYKELDGVVFVGATLWTDVSNPIDKFSVSRGLYDFSVIACSSPLAYGNKFSLDVTQREHEYSKHYLFQTAKQFKEQGKKVVIITHHGVSEMSIHQRFKGHPANAGFVSNLDDLIIDTDPDLMIHGHVHNCFDYKINNTRVVVNPKGYPQENFDFNPTLVLEI